MRCFKCKKEIADNLLRCNFCNTKVQTVCPVCGELNPITTEYCKGCGLQLIKYCPVCKCANLPNAKQCRKCSASFEENKEQKEIAVNKSNDIKENTNTIAKEINIISEDNAQNSEISKKDENEQQLETILSKEEFEEEKEEDFSIEELPDNELIDFADGDDIDKIDSTKQIEQEKNIDENSDSIDEAQDQVTEQTNDDEISLTETQIEDLEESSLLGLADTSDKISEELEKEDIKPDSIINADAAKNLNNEQANKQSDNEKEAANSEDTAYENTKEEKQLIEIKSYDQIKCKSLLTQAIRKQEKRIIGISAPEGYGKSTVLKYLFSDLVHQNYAWLWGECSANSQISPFGIFQEMILTFFNMPNFSNMSAEFIKDAKKMLSETLPLLSQEDIFNLFNFLYPSLTSSFEEILINKDTTFALLEKVILEISKKAKLIIVIDDFDMIDGASYAFLSYFIEQNHLSENIKLIISYKDNRITQGYFYSEKLAQNQYEDIRLAKLSKKDAENFVKMFLNGTNLFPENIFEEIYEYSKGNSAYIEQIMVLFNENNAFYPEGNTLKYKTTELESNIPRNIYEILTMRVSYLQQKYPVVYKTLCTAAIMGNKFNVKLLEIIMKIKSEDFQKVLQMLTTFAYLSQFNNNIFEFKNTLLWKFIYERAKQSADFVVLNEKIFDIINAFTLSSNALKALVAQNLNQKLLALNIWTENIKLCAYLGDEHLWTLSQKQCLKIVQEINPENNNVIINNIHERLGKLLYISRPQEAVPYLSSAINNAIKVQNIPKIIELSGYLSKSCALTGNYHGVIEAVDTVLKFVEKPENKLECALVKFKKLNAMFSIGNAEEIYNLASNEIIPIVEQALSNVIPTNGISMNVIYETWLECNLTVAMALISQGNNKSFAILNVIDEIVAKNHVENKNYLQRLKIAKALAYTMQGSIKQSEDILITFSQETANDTVEPQIISLWNFTNILNKLFKQEWQNIKEDLFSIVTFANNYNDVLIKNILKVFLGKILQEEGNLSKALDIYNEQVTVFAKEKIAIGALLCWYYIAKITLVTDGSDKALDIAQKALDVAKNPKISNYYFIVLYKKLIAEIFLIKGDTESSKMYIEKALMIVKQYDMKLLKVSLYQLYAKYLEEMVSKKPENKTNYAQNAMNTYKKAISLISNLEIPAVETEIKKNLNSFKAFCQLNNIKI